MDRNIVSVKTRDLSDCRGFEHFTDCRTPFAGDEDFA